VGQSILYALDNLVLEVNSAEPVREDLDRLITEVSWVKGQDSFKEPNLYLSVSLSNDEFKIPKHCRLAFRTDAFCGYEIGDEFYLTDGSSLLHIGPGRGEGHAQLAASFFAKPKLTQANFWCFGLLKLLRPLGIYSLHAAGLSTSHGEGVLLVGPTESGKSTLAIGLIRVGWRYLSDDAVLLRDHSQGVEALACRRSFYIDAARSADYSDFCLGDEEPDSNGGRRRNVGINEAYPAQYIAQCLPRIVIFPKITEHSRSMLRRIGKVSALGSLLAQSAPQLFDRSTMSGHLELLKRLLREAETYELNAGSDLYHQPAKLIDLLGEARGAGNCRVSSLS
jgi:hypothetical protein